MAEINDYWYIVEGKMTFVKIRDDIAEEVIIKLCGREPDSFGGFHNLLDNRHFIFNDLDKINTDKDFNEERWGSIDINGLFRRLERLEDANERLLKQLKESREREREESEEESESECEYKEEDNCASCKKELIDDGVMFMGKYLCLSCAYNDKAYE